MQENDTQLVALSSMSVGQKGLIVAFSFETQGTEHVQQADFSPGEQLEVVNLPSLGDTIEVKIRGYFVSLRKDDASRIKIRLFS